MTVTESKIQEVDIEMAKRFAWFRNEYVSPKQIEASKMINCSQGKLSEIEAGKRKIDFKTLRNMALKFNLNTDWLSTGDGDPISEIEPTLSGDNEAKMKAFEKSIRELKSSLLSIERALKLMEANQNGFINAMQRHHDKQQETIKSLLRVIEDQRKNQS